MQEVLVFFSLSLLSFPYLLSSFPMPSLCPLPVYVGTLFLFSPYSLYFNVFCCLVLNFNRPTQVPNNRRTRRESREETVLSLKDFHHQVFSLVLLFRLFCNPSFLFSSVSGYIALPLPLFNPLVSLSHESVLGKEMLYSFTLFLPPNVILPAFSILKIDWVVTVKLLLLQRILSLGLCHFIIRGEEE